MLITGWGDPSVFTNATWLAASDPVLIVLIACQVELFFAWRLWIIGRQRWIVVVICFFSIVELLSGIGTGIAVMWVKEYALFPSFAVIAIIWTVAGAVADVFIALGMTYYLHRVKGSYDATDKVVDRVILREHCVNLCNLKFIFTPCSYSAEWTFDDRCICSPPCSLFGNSACMLLLSAVCLTNHAP